MKKLFSIITISLFMSCGIKTETITQENTVTQDAEMVADESKKMAPNKIKVLNFATFHMGETTDANKVDFDEKNLENQKNASTIAKMISKFKPTIICVEVPFEEQNALTIEFDKYLSDSEKGSTYKGEIGLIAFASCKAF